MNLPSLENAALLGRRDGQESWRVGDTVVRLVRLPERLVGADGRLEAEAAAAARVGEVFGVPAWRRIGYVSRADRRALDLGEGRWIYAVRDFVEGRSLRELSAAGGWLDRALGVAYALREVHERGWAHGDLQPGHVVVGEDDSVWLIDLALFSTAAGDRGHVAGSAPLMAPERWEGRPASAAADVYALGALVCWLASGGRWPHAANSLSQWAQAHRHRRPEVPGALTGRFSGLIGRMLAKQADRRPPLQAFIDAAGEAGASATLPAVSPLGEEIDQTVTAAADALADGVAAVVVVDRDRKRFASSILSQLARRLELGGERVIHLRAGSLCGVEAADGAGDEGDDPLELAFRIVEALSDDPQMRAHLAEEAGRGDQLHTFEVFCDALFEAISEDGLTVVWEEFEAAGRDVRRWWTDVMDQVEAGGRPQRLRSVLGAAPVEADGNVVVLEPASRAAVWGRWRANTLRTEVRDIAGGHWRQLVERARGRPDRLVQLINERVGAAFDADEVPMRESGVHRAPTSVDGWRARIEALTERGAFSEAAQCCREVHAMRSALSDDERAAVLECWTDVVLRGAGGRGDLDRLERALDAELDHFPVATKAALGFARLAHSQGRHAEGLERLERVAERLDERLSGEADPGAAADLAQCRLWQAQLTLSSGRLGEAGVLAREGLSLVERAEPADLQPVQSHLELLQEGASAIGGEAAAIEALERLLGRLQAAGAPEILQARCHAYRALGLTRHDRGDEATEAYRRALEIVESAGLVSELPSYLLDVGTAYHRQGRLGLAREYYARGARVSRPSTRASTRAQLWANQANIEQTLGRLEEARASLERAWQVATPHELAAVEILCHSIEGELELAEGAPERALASFQIPLEADDLPLSTIARAELLLHSAEACLQMGDRGRCMRLLDQARTLVEEHELAGLEGHHGMLRARAQWSEGGSVGVMAGIELFRRSLLQAARAGNHKLVLRQSPHLWRRLDAERLTELMEEVAEVVRDSRNAVATGLTREVREDFFAHLPALELADGPRAEADATPSSGRVQSARDNFDARRVARTSGERDELIERFHRMLSLNEVLLHHDDLEALAPRALEIALSLSGAERGFVLLRDVTKARVGDFHVAASRDVRGQPLPRPHLEVSLTVAEEAARTGQTVVTIDAAEDQRFEAALSVVDLDLTSVLCVPVRDSGGLWGALYLDHRFEPGVFEGGVARMMEAFGHQFALAITNVRRVEQLDAERRELTEAKARLDERLAERELMLGELEQRCDELSEEVERQRKTAGVRERFAQIAFTSRAMQQVLEQADRVARSDIPLVVTGESGVGKELVARGIHRASSRKDGPFVAFNCGAVSETLIESEMFGHKKDAFTGAEAEREGFFHAADGGTIFLDELGEIPLSMQAKLLRVLQEGAVRRVGATRPEPVDVRVVAATDRDLEQMVDEGGFRQDLYCWLAAFVIEVPPLRERREDIPLVARTLLDRICEEMGGRQYRLEPQGAVLLSKARWPGNVRELENTLRAACALADGEVLGERELAPLLQIRHPGEEGATRSLAPRGRSDGRGRKPKAGRPEVVEALRRAGGDREAAADALGVSVRTLYRYLKRYEIE